MRFGNPEVTLSYDSKGSHTREQNHFKDKLHGLLVIIILELKWQGFICSIHQSWSSRGCCQDRDLGRSRFHFQVQILVDPSSIPKGILDPGNAQ